MRKIKFRGLTDDHVWVYGWFTDDDLSPDIIDGMSTRHKVLSKTVGQYIGLNDSNGKEIYEGDIVECGSGRICQVVFFKSECACCFDLSPVGGFDCEPPKESTLWKDLTVIGNIYDNPELRR